MDEQKVGEAEKVLSENLEDEERPDSQASYMINSEYGTPVKEAAKSCTIENSLYDKYNIQEREMEKIEAQNAEYREKLVKTIRERDLNEELLRNVQGQHKKELDSQIKRIRDLEIQLKATMDKSTAQEAHFNVTSREMSQKYNSSVQQLTKKADQNEKDKNEAVVKYAMREGEMMKIREEIKNKDIELKNLKIELEQNLKSQCQENVQELEKTINNLNVDVEKLKHEKFDFENRLKIAEKRAETLTLNLSEAKQQSDVLRKQLIQTKDEKTSFHHQEFHKKESEFERKMKEAENTMERLRASQLDMATKFEEASRENSDLLSKIDILQDQLSLEEDRRKLCEEQIERLRGVENFVQSSSQQIEETQKEKETADADREQAEEEAKRCREHAEKMLNLNQQLTEKNAELQRQIGELQTENEGLKREVKQVESRIKMVDELMNELKEENEHLRKVENEIENIDEIEKEEEKSEEVVVQEEYKEKYESCLKMLEDAENRLTEEHNNFSAYKKKTHANMKELRGELSQFRKEIPASSDCSTSVLVPPNTTDSVPSMSSRSRASSITSIDQVTSNSREEEESKQEEARKLEQQQSLQQTMVDKIVSLQRKLAKRGEKIEFLEEHVKQCLDELQKKTKIIQHYALREEASLLMPSEGSLEKLFASCEFVQVPICRNGSTYALMGAMFKTNSEKKQTQILSEVNSRLQAVLEDVIQKNIAMRSTVDTLTTENAKLARETRLLTLSQARLQDQQQDRS